MGKMSLYIKDNNSLHLVKFMHENRQTYMLTVFGEDWSRKIIWTPELHRKEFTDFVDSKLFPDPKLPT